MLYSRRTESERQVPFRELSSPLYYFLSLAPATSFEDGQQSSPLCRCHRRSHLRDTVLRLDTSAVGLSCAYAAQCAPRRSGTHLLRSVSRDVFPGGAGAPAVIAGALRTAIGLLQLRPWARLLSMFWAAGCVTFCLAIIAFLPFETFVIPRQFVSQIVLTKQMIGVSFVVMLLPVSVWWLFYFRTRNVKLQFLSCDSTEAASVTSSSEKT